MKLALGSAQFGLDYGIVQQQAKLSADEAADIISLAAANGILTLDTAIDYGDAERRLGELGMSRWRIVSKLPSLQPDCDDIAQWVRQQIGGSLERLQVERLYGLLLHRPLDLLGEQGNALYRALLAAREEGLVSKIGISIYDPSELDQLCGRYRFDLVQAPFNPVDRRILQSGWMTRLDEAGIELHVRSIFMQGLLLMERHERPSYFDTWAKLWSDFADWLRQTNQTAVEACVGFALSFDGISRAIVGVAGLQQLEEIIRAAAVDAQPVPDAIACADLDLIDPLRWIGRV